MNTTDIAAAARMHPFEKSGLGVAPFRCVGNYVAKFQAVPGDPSCPILPGGACAYCGQGIMDVFVVRSLDGREFTVGSDCIAKVGKLLEGTEHEREAIKTHKQILKFKREAAHKRDDEKIAAAKELLERVASRLDHEVLRRVDFYLLSNRCGRAGKLKGAKLLAAAVAEMGGAS